MAFEGERIGAPCDSVGELVFTTGMEGYIETLTDPSYAGQIVMQTFPLIGNYGVIEEDFEGKSLVKGYVVRELCRTPSNFRCEYTVDEFLKKNGICGICGVDTREITRIIRENGVMNAVICDKIPKDLTAVKEYIVRDVVKDASTDAVVTYPSCGETQYRVVLIDYGAKKSIIRCLNMRGCEVTVVPYNASAEYIEGLSPDGIMLSNGPGNPQDNTYSIEQIKKLVGRIPIFGICLGHQLTALAMGGQTVKLKYGHRGANHPVKEAFGKRTYITSQNHGYTVVTGSLDGIGKEIFTNANDGSCEGLEYEGKKCFTVQFHPEASSGPHDAEFLFDRFISMMRGEKVAEG